MQVVKVITASGTFVEDGLVIVAMVVLEEALGIWFAIDAEKNISVKSKQQQERRYFHLFLFFFWLSVCLVALCSQLENKARPV